jgi:ABC-type multidrug transport system ATPase subunit
MTLVAQQLSKRLGRRAVLVQLNLHCGPTELVVLRGENGSGKSTLLRIFAGILDPDAGQVSICGHGLDDGGTRARQQLGYVPDATEPLPELLVGEFLELVRALKQAPPAPAELLAQLAVSDLRLQRMSTLSFGQRKRVCLAAALLGDPWLLLLDEPSNGLDPDGVRMIEALLTARAARGKATILATNDEAFASAVHGTEYRLEGGQLHALAAPAAAP